MTISGCSPIAEKLRKRWPLTSATGSSIVRPCASAAIASLRSSGIFRSLAKWLCVPSGRTPNDLSESATTLAMVLMVPSPPPAKIASNWRPRAASWAMARLDEADVGLRAGVGEAARDLLLRVGHVQPGERAGAFVQQDHCLHCGFSVSTGGVGAGTGDGAGGGAGGSTNTVSAPGRIR
jgi:hypothetical protein